MTEKSSRPRIPAPAGLRLAGRRLWKRVVSDYQLRADELFVLEMAAKTLDTVVEIEAAMVGQPLTVKGSMGQTREHPLLSEARQQRAALARLLGQLKLPDVDVPAAGQRSAQARAAASARWASRGPT